MALHLDLKNKWLLFIDFYTDNCERPKVIKIGLLEDPYFLFELNNNFSVSLDMTHHTLSRSYLSYYEHHFYTGIVYGIKSFSLYEDASCSFQEAWKSLEYWEVLHYHSNNNGL